jgi:putative solute:sodium symporter small subunit
MSDPAHQRLWQQTRRLTAALLLSWLAVCLSCAWFARGLNGVTLFGFPMGFWVAAQGALLAFLLIVAVYVVCMDRLEADYLRDVQAASATAAPGGPVPP